MLVLGHYGKGFLARASALIAIVVMSIVSAFFGKLDLSPRAGGKLVPHPAAAAFRHRL